MDIEEILETVRKENPEIYQVIIAFLKEKYHARK